MRQTTLSKIASIIVSTIPIAISILLLVIAFFYEPEAGGKIIQPSLIAWRDQFFGFDMPEPNIIWSVGNYGKVIRSNDGGKTWVKQVVPVSVTLQDIAAWDGLKAVAVGNEGKVILTQDGGKSWRYMELPVSKVANKLFRVKVAPDKSVWIVGEMNAVFVSRDFGSTWERVTKEADAALHNIAFLDAKTLWVVGEFGRMLSTVDGGKTWSLKTSPSKVSLMGIAFKDRLQGVAVGLEGAILETNDGGKTWTEAKKVTNSHLFDVTVNKESWSAVGDMGIVLAKEIGSNWKAFRLGENDLSWHTKVLATSSKEIYMSGSTIGVYANGRWVLFKG